MSNIPDSNLPDEAEEPRSPGPDLQIYVSVDAEVVASDLNIDRLRQGVQAAANLRACHRGQIGLRITDDDSIRSLNRQHLKHDYATDVLSYGYRCDPPDVEADLVVSHDTARRQSTLLNWTAEDELLLYVVHGTLHACGMDDADPAGRAAMRDAERRVLLTMGVDKIRECGVEQDRAGVAAKESCGAGEDFT